MMALFQAGICPLPDAIKGTMVKKSQTNKNRPGGKIGGGLIEIPFPTYWVGDG
jgi:hypothetical protein